MTAVEPQVQYTTTYVTTTTTEEYMIQEDDWDRDLLLDPAWEKQQRKVKSVLSERGRKPRFHLRLSRISLVKIQNTKKHIFFYPSKLN